jgi:hypothetical protein
MPNDPLADLGSCAHNPQAKSVSRACRPHAGGDPSIKWHNTLIEMDPLPARGQHY